MNVTNAMQSGFMGLNRGLDNAPRAASDVTGSGKPDEVEQASGRKQDEAVVESAGGASVEAAATKVVGEVEELGQPGSIINIRV
ncbi:hypothetical protein [Neptuniibacter sp. 2_MG-2023]|uniref:hypothetical protein n=1 Tax=Neptuniibacter sp. 2_MG-2023 TaxID=3062671 RepID=UPI0026E387E5|nr:hypothetical protein [Neptuniibacter sp. 2_MG-2023]MDO6512957.1 hypothetical protein [Neptuniibacter sp. 2_MG-2023]